MRARLNKTQMQMLLDGKEIRSPRMRFALSPGESEVRTILQNFVNSEELREKYAVFLDMSERQIVVEEKK